MVGQIGLPGGGFGFGYGSINGMGVPRRPIASPAMEAGSNPLGLAIPVARMADMLLEPGRTIPFDGKTVTYPDIRLVYWAGGNPFHHHQDINRLVAAWRRPETIIVQDIWWTATAQQADIVLPATTSFERDDIGASPLDRFIVAMPQLIPPQHAARNDYDIFAELADRLGFESAFTEGRDIRAWIEHVYEAYRTRAVTHDVALPPFAAFWKAGFVEVPPPRQAFTLFGDFRADPVAHRLRTPSGRIEIASREIESFGYDDCPGHPTWLPPREWLGSDLVETYPLHLISNQPATRLHSQLDKALLSQESKVAGHEPIVLNPIDAERRGIASGDLVRVYNDRGSCLAGAVVSDDVRAGVVQLATGAWYRPEAFASPGSPDFGGNPNVLTRDAGTSSLGQGPSALSALVEVEKMRACVAVSGIEDQPVKRDTSAR
jgi:biotin/methionine sulfoxide reductase